MNRGANGSGDIILLSFANEIVQCIFTRHVNTGSVFESSTYVVPCICLHELLCIFYYSNKKAFPYGHERKRPNNCIRPNQILFCYLTPGSQ